MRAATLLLTAFIILPAIAAEQLPQLDVQGACNRMSSSRGDRSEALFGRCIEREQKTYDDLKARWPVGSDAAIRTCTRTVMSHDGTGYYTLLLSCIDRETAAQKSNVGREFRR